MQGLPGRRTMEKYKANAGETKGTVLVEESIFKTMLAGPRPITTTLVIKPGAVKHLSKILKRVSQEDFIVVAMQLVTLDNRQARALVPEREAENSVICGMHLDHLRSGPVLVLVLQRENAVRKLLSLLGPNNPKEAKKKNEFLWRGMFGGDPINNAFHGSVTYAKAVEEQALFFPEGLCCRQTSDLKADKILCPAVDTILGSQLASKRSFMLTIGTPGGVGDTRMSSSGSSTSLNGELSPRSIGVGTSTADLALHSHSALCQTNCILLTPPLQLLSVQGHRKGYVDVIDCLRHRSFLIVEARMVWFNQAQAKEFFSIYSGAFPNLVQLLCHGPSIVLAIQRDNAVSCLGSLLGNMLDKDSVINKYGKHILRPKDTKEAIKHLEFFFNELIPGSQGEIVADDAPFGFLST